MMRSAAEHQGPARYPLDAWESCAPDQVGIDPTTLDELAALVTGRGCVVRHGYMVYTWGDPAQSSDVASAFKPLLSTLLLLAVQEGKIGSVDDEVAAFEPRLRGLNGGKDGAITWRHLASQTSGYGLIEAPGEAYAYNDYALALYYDTLMGKVFRQHGTEVMKRRLADVLQFQDRYTFEAFGPDDRPGRLAVSVRDFARFGWLYLQKGRWRGRQILSPESIELALSSPVPAETPLSSGEEADMLPGQRSIGGGKTITPLGPGCYSFNWWLNTLDSQGRRQHPDLPSDTCMASGHGGKRLIWVVPSFDLVVVWNDTSVNDHQTSPGNRRTRLNRAARLVREMIG